MKHVSLLIAALAVALMPPGSAAQNERPLFELLSPEETGVTFMNVIRESEGMNVLEYEYFYNGGGVAIGDFDGDGLPDIFLTANMGPNRLYRNLGDMRFEDVTDRAGVAGGPGWSTGVTLADVNGNGLLDIYVCKSGDLPEDQRRNELYINQGSFRFREQAKRFGVDDPGYSTHAVFFDYDGDGDLDLFVLNHNVRRLERFDVELVKAMRDPYAGDRLYRNDGGRFVDVSEEAGIIGNPIGFGLSATAGDFNQNGLIDLYVANDYVEDDYLYINNGDGTFSEEIRSYMGHTSYFSMGADFADVSGNGLPDLVTLDMLPEDNRRQKLLKGPDHYDYYQMMIGYGYHHQHMRNMLQLNNGDGTFSEIGQLAGISNTDWSWAALLADFDNDGFNDLYVTNGYVRDYTNMDFLKYIVPEAHRQAQLEGKELTLYELVRQMPSTQLRNYIFRNRGDLRFEDQTEAWGFDQYALSNGAAYADLDGDGDLDLVVNNINQPVFIYRNNADRITTHHYLKIRLEGEGENRFGIGSRVRVTSPDGRVFYRELITSRGYQSSVEPVLHFGLGDAALVDVEVLWPDGRQQILRGVSADQLIVAHQADAVTTRPAPAEAPDLLLVAVHDDRGVPFVHQEDSFIDFKREPLLPHMLSRLGPALAAGDVNGDGLDDVFVGGARGQPSVLYLQQDNGSFLEHVVLRPHAWYEDVDAIFFDANGNGHLDLYVVSGGNDEVENLALYQDRLYLNSGDGGFSYVPNALPEIAASGSVVAAHDFDGDGQLDLFVGGRVVPGGYPASPRSYLLRNEGGRFVDVTADVAPDLLLPGMVTDAIWADLDGDGTSELVVVGEWMPVRVFKTGADAFIEVTKDYGLDKTNGWWNCVLAVDLNGNGRLDLVLGNRGLNAQMQASEDQPASIHAIDLGGRNVLDPIVSYYIHGTSYPMASRDELLDQVTPLRRRYVDYASYADVSIDELLGEAPKEADLSLEAYVFESLVLENLGEGRFRRHSLPIEAQFAPVNCILSMDVDGDGVPDLVLAGNNFGVRAQMGRYDAGQGLILLGQGDLSFAVSNPGASGFSARGDVRKMIIVRTQDGLLLKVGNNDAAVTSFHFRQRS